MTLLPDDATPDPRGPEFADAIKAREYILDHDQAVKRWYYRMNSAQRAALVREATRHATGGGNWVLGGPGEWSRDEQVNELARLIYPHANAAREVYYQAVSHE